ncbi:hypothetical protein GF342_02130 [Candidatus Woesearchaeota archaeon]|nr:hypothetical protein [Candidatus Woesearchaeota archaeon]
MAKLEQAIDVLCDLADDPCVPRTVREHISRVIGILKSSVEMSLRISRALGELEELAEHEHVQSDTRMQLFSVATLLENE